ncbi:MAG: hypothetical protein SFV23_13475 [Planctomycetaceae bacterium]|nr:hypothetical protein [Planctomycetaceae bacterium]
MPPRRQRPIQIEAHSGNLTPATQPCVDASEIMKGSAMDVKLRLGCCVAAELLLLTCVGMSQELNVEAPPKATVEGKYSHLLRMIRVPEDEKQYGKFADYGYYAVTEYAGHADLVPGYWVYVAPAWYIWSESAEPAGDQLKLAVDGPEAKDLVRGITGQIVFCSPAGDIFALSLPEMRKSVVRPRSEGDFAPTIHALSGPDSLGRIAYIEDYFFVEKESDQKHLLKTITLDGTSDAEIFSRPGDAMWANSAAGHGEIGTYLAIAPSGNMVAFLSELAPRQQPRALLSVGKIEIWDVEKKRPNLVVRANALDQPMSWFPDGKRLAYVKLVPRRELPDGAPGLDRFGQYAGQAWEDIPAVHILDCATGNSTFLHVGWTPIVSPDGRAALVGGWDKRMEYSWNWFDLGKRKSTEVQLPGDYGGAFAMPRDDLVLYWGLPTTGASLQNTKDDGSVNGTTFTLTLKLANMNTTEFQTVLPQIVPKSLVSFGQVRK